MQKIYDLIKNRVFVAIHVGSSTLRVRLNLVGEMVHHEDCLVGGIMKMVQDGWLAVPSCARVRVSCRVFAVPDWVVEDVFRNARAAWLGQLEDRAQKRPRIRDSDRFNWRVHTLSFNLV